MKINSEIKENLKKRLDDLLKNRAEKITLTSAYPLNNAEIESLYQSLPILKKTKLNFDIDKKVIAGVVIKIGSKVIDLSLSGNLNKLKEYIYEVD